MRTKTRAHFSLICQPQLHSRLHFPIVCQGRKRHSRYLSVKLPCGNLSGSIQTHREGKNKGGKKREGEGRARGALVRLTAPALTSQRRASSLPSTSPPLALCAPPPPLSPPCAAPLGCNCPLGSARGGRMCRRACTFVCVCMCVCAGETWVLVACLSALQRLLTFFSLPLTWLQQPSVAHSLYTHHAHCYLESDLFKPSPFSLYEVGSLVHDLMANL